MLTTTSRWILLSSLMLSGMVGLLRVGSRPLAAAEEIPQQLSDEAFRKLTTDFSEAGGYFRSDNFVSNEITFQWVIPSLKKTTKTGGVYLGVGPDQNFTYIVALQPKIAFIFDIRRQNMMLHLMYKALIEMSKDRVEFASKLFSRKQPDLIPSVTPENLFRAYDMVTPDIKLYEANLKAIVDRLEKTHGFNLSTEDEQSIRFVYKAFFDGGPQITYSFSNIGGGRGRMPTYQDLMLEDDNQGVNWSYLATDENFQALKQLHERNLIVALVGDFAGDKAIRAVGRYLKEHESTVTAFYLSNVEQYLFQDSDNWKKFYRNVETLPLDSTSTFIRSVFNAPALSYAGPGFGALRSLNQICPMMDVLKAFNEGKITSYYDVITMFK